MRGPYVQKKERVAVRQSWRNCRNATAPAELSRLPEPHSLRQGINTPYAPALDTIQPRRLWRTPGRERNTLLPGRGLADLSGVAGRRVYRQGGRKPVLLPHPVKNPDMAIDVDALLAEHAPNERLGKAAAKLTLPVHIWYLWSATGIKSGTSENPQPATGIKFGTCRGVFSVPQVSDMNHSYLSHPQGLKPESQECTQ